MTLPPNTLINQRYEVLRQVGQGGMGAVYEAVDTRLGHHVALKQTLVADPQFARAFEREARFAVTGRGAFAQTVKYLRTLS